jgi:hypothetical protein
MTDTVRLTYRELAERLGIEPDSARIKLNVMLNRVQFGNRSSAPYQRHGMADRTMVFKLEVV